MADFAIDFFYSHSAIIFYIYIYSNRFYYIYYFCWHFIKKIV